MIPGGRNDVLLRGATVHPVSGPDIPNGTVLIRERKIAEVGERVAVRPLVESAERYRQAILEQGAQAWKVAEELKVHHIPVVLPPTLRLPDAEDDPYDKPFSISGELSKAGVKIASATFGPNAEQVPRNLPYQAAAAVPFGLSQEEALKSRNPLCRTDLGRRRGSRLDR